MIPKLMQDEKASRSMTESSYQKELDCKWEVLEKL